MADDLDVEAMLEDLYRKEGLCQTNCLSVQLSGAGPGITCHMCECNATYIDVLHHNILI
uniref:Uncharacterized protein n=1 Tax=Arion vulgaris TaxID=1028688 RepID=A0A0B6ZVX4_9EUPU